VAAKDTQDATAPLPTVDDKATPTDAASPSGAHLTFATTLISRPRFVDDHPSHLVCV
jgi:hypothetical protein